LDIGCGGGHTLLDACALGLSPVGIEPVPELVKFGKTLLSENGFDSERILQGDASTLLRVEEGSLDCISMLSVIPHIPESEWAQVHESISRGLSRTGKTFIAYRNELFDLYTANSFTHEFYQENFFSHWSYSEDKCHELMENLVAHIPNSTQPGTNHTNSDDKKFGNLKRVRSNPLVQAQYLSEFGLKIDEIMFCNFHPKLPSMGSLSREEISIKHNLELDLANKWQGYFMASMFIIVASKF
jgi:SAM-dependent methyltransferase